MPSRIFGTDGIRGVANDVLTADLTLRLGRALGLYLKEKFREPLVLLGKDPRLSSDMIECALAAGLLSAGIRTAMAGIVTTPALSVLVRSLSAQAGVMISASHNPIEDNGIKIFDARGIKLKDEEEDCIEELMRALSFVGPRFPEILSPPPKSAEIYLSFLRETVPQNLPSWHLVLDCAWGSTALFAPDFFRELGLRVTALHDRPDGSRINVECGATFIEPLRGEVLRRAADFGFSFDGDGDRMIAVDREGAIFDGDSILCAYGLHLLRSGRLPGNIVVGTVMSNLGLEMSISRAGGCFLRTKVGDRYVLEEMLERGAALGGEQSGHIIFLEALPAGDGILTGLMLLKLMQGTGKDLSELGKELIRTPQVLLNVPVEHKEFLFEDPQIQEQILLTERKLQNKGRVLVRPSGTEKLVRIMVEAVEKETAEEEAERLSALIRARLSF